MIFKGSGVAIITPFDEDDNINYSKFYELIEYQIKNGTDAIIVSGTTGEAPALSDDERRHLMRFAVNKVNKRVPVIIGTGCYNTDYSIELSQYAEFIGADGLLLVTPYYNKCTQEGLYEHFKKIAESVTIPSILYNVPSRTCVNIEAETLVRLSKITNIVGIKEASGNFSQIARMLSLVPNDFAIYSGNDDQTLPLLALGGSGIISVAANIIPKEMHQLCDTFFNGNLEEARKIQLTYLDLMKHLFTEVNPIPIKEAMNILGYEVGPCRLPLCSMSANHKAELEKALTILTEKN